MQNKKYDAFISYRHLSFDKAVAVRLQELLEHYKPPKNLICGNANRIKRVFRDESELPTSGDLNEELNSALENSNYLIVLCSPELKESGPCMQEISYFKELHGGSTKRILPLLIAGTPAESFPYQLLSESVYETDENGVVSVSVVDVEPLACNIIADNEKKSLKKLNAEFLRIAAPILGCDYDDLYGRHKKRRVKRNVLYGAGVLISTLLIVLLIVFMNFRIRGQRSETYIEYSTKALASGNVREAVSYALGAMPPYTPQAQKTLAAALGAYDLTDGYEAYNIMELPSKIIFLTISDDGLTAAAVCGDFSLVVFNTFDAKIIDIIPTTRSTLAEARFLNDSTIVFAGPDGITAYDVPAKKIIWNGTETTGISLSADKDTIAAVYKDGGEAVIYDADGSVKTIIPFNGRKQRAVNNDIFANAGGNLFELSGDGIYLAVGFDDGSLVIFNSFNNEIIFEIPGDGSHVYYDGGFTEKYFIFTSIEKSGSFFGIVDLNAKKLIGGFETDARIGVGVFNNKIYYSFGVQIKMIGADWTESIIAAADAEIVSFTVNERGIIAATSDHGYTVYDADAKFLHKYADENVNNFIGAAGDYAVISGRDTPFVKILRFEDNSASQIFKAINDRAYAEARINSIRTRVMFFSHDHFRVYNIDGVLLNETEIPDAGLVTDQQYDKKTGNLIIIYGDALRIYSGADGSLLFEKTGVKSVFYARYGISVLDDNVLNLIGADGQIISEHRTNGNFAAYAGMIIDDDFLNGREFIGAAERTNGYLFAVSDGENGAVYDENGRELFKIATGNHSEAFFTDNAVIIRPLLKTPAVYDLKNGKKICDLEAGAYLSYVYQLDGRVLIDYVSANGGRFATLLDGKTFRETARLNNFTDIINDEMIFDHGNGSLRAVRIYSIEELIGLSSDYK